MLSTKISSCRQELQQNTGKSSKPSSFTMVPDSIDRHALSSGAKDSLRKLTRLIRRLGGVCDWPERRIAARLGLCRGTYRDHRRKLEATGQIELERRRREGCRLNDTNILRLGGGGLKIQPQKQSEVLTTTTPAPTAQVSIAKSDKPKNALQRFWESRFAQDRKDSDWRRDQYQRKATFWDSVKGWQLEKARERTRRASEAMVGMYTGKIERMSDAEWRAYEAEMAILDAKRDERLRRQHGGMMGERCR
jgi:hypothetical protein